MIAPDANLLIYAYDTASPFHTDTRRWLEEVLSAQGPVGIPIHSIYAFLRFVTNPRIAPHPVSFQQATDVVNSWTSLPQVSVMYPGVRHLLLLEQLGQEVKIAGAQVTDAAIAALALEFGAIVYTNDRDFARYPGLKWHNPLKPLKR